MKLKSGDTVTVKDNIQNNKLIMSKNISLRAANKPTLTFPHFVGISKDEVRIIANPAVSLSLDETYECIDHTGFHVFKLTELKETRTAKGDWAGYDFAPNHLTYSITRL